MPILVPLQCASRPRNAPMSSSPNGPSPRSRPARVIDCAGCTHFRGRNGFVRIEFDCAKGHPAESDITLTRFAGCSDFKSASRDELIFRRFRSSAEWHGDETLKKRQAAVRRTASLFAQAVTDFGEMMDGKQLEASKEAIAALNQLGNDIERASRLAKAHKQLKDRERKEEECRKVDALAAKLMAGWSDDEVISCAEDAVQAIYSDQGRKWIYARRGTHDLVDGSPMRATSRLMTGDKLQRQQPASNLLVIRRELALFLAGLSEARSKHAVNREDFDAYRAWRREQQRAAASVDALLTKAKRGWG